MALFAKPESCSRSYRRAGSEGEFAGGEGTLSEILIAFIRYFAENSYAHTTRRIARASPDERTAVCDCARSDEHRRCTARSGPRGIESSDVIKDRNLVPNRAVGEAHRGDIESDPRLRPGKRRVAVHADAPSTYCRRLKMSRCVVRSRWERPPVISLIARLCVRNGGMPSSEWHR